MTATDKDRERNGSGAAAGRVLVIGSANVDISVHTAALPGPGETVAGDSCVIGAGGKGANQAAASALCGAPTDFVGRVGADDFAALVLRELARCGVDHERTLALPGHGTGLAAIYVEASGQNCIVVVPGANAAFTPQDIDALEPAIRSAAILVLQCELPLPTVWRAVALAGDCGTPVIFNPAPSHGLDLQALPRGITYFVPNETEAAALTGMAVGDPAQAGRCAQKLRATGIDCVIITRGAAGCVLADGDGLRVYPAPAVAVVDTTGAGDAFIGCLAASLARGLPRDAATQRALAYASLATTRRGAMSSYPGLEAFERQAPCLPDRAPGGGRPA